MKYRKKPIIVDAVPYIKGLEDGFKCCVKEWNCYNPCDKCPDYKPYIKTLEGRMTISEDYYIITGIKGERYPIKKDIFELTYEVVK